LTNDQELCSFCGFRSLCERGIEAGNINDLVYLETDEGKEISFDIEQISELEF
jgi:hypothetical protein